MSIPIRILFLMALPWTLYTGCAILSGSRLVGQYMGFVGLAVAVIIVFDHNLFTQSKTVKSLFSNKYFIITLSTILIVMAFLAVGFEVLRWPI